jgi:hypothetical protein
MVNTDPRLCWTELALSSLPFWLWRVDDIANTDPQRDRQVIFAHAKNATGDCISRPGWTYEFRV